MQATRARGNVRLNRSASLDAILKILLVVGVLICCQLAAIAETPGWTSHQYYDPRYKAWWVQVSSTLPRSFIVTVNWHGNRGYGGAVRGSFALLVPAYPGFGAPVTAQKGIPGVHHFGYTIVPN
jgi:hypothetical protein